MSETHSTNPPLKSTALASGLRIIEFLAGGGAEPRSLKEISTAVGLAGASALRLLRALCEAGYVRRDEVTKLYELTSRLLRLGVERCADRSFVEAGSLPLRRLRDLTGETAQLVCLFGEDCILLDQHLSTLPFKFSGELGSRTPWWLCAPGKAMAAALSESDFDALMDRWEKQPPKLRRNRSRQDLTAEILKVREQGWGFDDEEHIPGLRCVGAAICDMRGRLVGGLTIAGFKDRFDGERLDELVEAVLVAREQIARSL